MLNILLKYPMILMAYLRLRPSRDKSLKNQKQIFRTLITKAKNTQFGVDHNFKKIKDYEDFKSNVPLREYKDYHLYLSKVLEGKENVLWPTPYKYLLSTAKSTGDGDDKFIPISQESLNNLVQISLNMLINFAVKTKNYSILLKRGLYLGASPKLSQKGKYEYGLLSGVSYYLKPKFLRNFSIPSFKTSAIENWEEKIKAIENEVIENELGIIVGTPPWVNKLVMNLNRRVKKPLNQHFKELTLFMFGGAPIKLYKKKIQTILGEEVYLLENYPASEAFVAYQDEFPYSSGLLLQTDHGVFFEFLRKEDYYNKNLENRLQLSEVNINEEYAIVLTTDSGLFSYLLGDIIEFTDLDPFRIKINGRLRHYLKLKGQYLNDNSLSHPLYELIQNHNLLIGEFTFAPGKNGVELYYETQNNKILNEQEMKKVKDSFDFEVKLVQINEDAIYEYMKKHHKLGGQFKITRIRNDRNIVEKFKPLSTNQSL